MCDSLVIEREADRGGMEQQDEANTLIRFSRCEVCGGLVAEGAACRRCEQLHASPSVESKGRKRTSLIVGASVAVVVVAVVLGVVLSGVLKRQSVEATYYASFSNITLRLAQSSRELVPLLNDFGDWDETELIRMIALTGVMFDTCEEVRALTCPAEAVDAHALLLKAVYHYDLACQQTRAFTRQTGQTEGFPDPEGALDASRSLYEGDRMRIQAQAEVQRLTRSADDGSQGEDSDARLVGELARHSGRDAVASTIGPGIRNGSTATGGVFR